VQKYINNAEGILWVGRTRLKPKQVVELTKEYFKSDADLKEAKRVAEDPDNKLLIPYSPPEKEKAENEVSPSQDNPSNDEQNNLKVQQQDDKEKNEVVEEEEKDYFDLHWKKFEKEIKEINDIEALKQLLTEAKEIEKEGIKKVDTYIRILNEQIKKLS